MKKIFYLLNIILLSFGLNEVKAQTCSSYKVLTSEIKICQNSVGINLLNNINISVNGTTSKLSAYPSTMFSLDSLYFNNTQQSTFSYLGTITALSNSTNSFFTPRFYAITKNANSITNADINKTEFFNVYFKLPSCTKIYSVKIYVVPFERAYFDFSNNYDNDFYETAKNLDDVKEYRNLGSTCGYTKFFLNKYAFPYSNTNVISGKNVTPTGEYPKSYSGVARVDSVTILHTSADGCIFTGYGKIVINDLDPRLKNILIDKSTNEIDLNFGILPTYYQNVFTYEAYLNSSTNKVCFSPQQNITSALIQKGNLPNATSVTEIYNGNGLPINTNDFYFKNSGDSLTINLNKNKNYYNVSINYSMLYAPILQANYPLYGCNIKFNSDLNINFPRMDSLKNIRICNKDTIIDLTKEIKASIPVKAFSWTGLAISNNLFNSSLIKNDTIIKQTLNIEETNTTCTNYNLSRFVYISKPKNLLNKYIDTSICFNKPYYLSDFLSYNNKCTYIVNSNSFNSLSAFNNKQFFSSDTSNNITWIENKTDKYSCPFTLTSNKKIFFKIPKIFTAKDTSVCSSAISYNLLSGVNYTNGSFSYKLLNAGLNDTILKGNTLNIGNWNNLNTITDVNVRYSYLDNNGCTSNLDRKISVKSANQLDLGADYNICNDLASLNLKPKFNVINALTKYGVDSVKLAFSNPNLFNGYIFNSKDVATGTYTVNGAITNQYGCTSTDFLRINVGYRPVVNLGGDSTICVNSDTLISYNLNNLLKDKVGNWSGSGVNDSLLTLRGSQAGNYQVRYNYTSPDGCSVNASKLFRINYVRVDAGRDYALCQNEQTPIQINANTKVWDDFENTKLLDNVGYNTISPTSYMNGYSFLTYLAPKGKYSWELRYTSALGCVATDTLNIGIGESKAISFGAADTSICLSDTLTKLNLKKLVSLDSNTTFSGDGVANGFFLVKNRPANSYIIKATHVTNEGCTSEAVKTINLIALSARITSDSSFISAGNGSRFYSNSVNANSYKWVFKSKLTSDTIFKENPFFYGNNAKDTINVSLQVTSPEGCKLTVSASQNFIVKRLSSDLDVTETGNFNFLNGSPDSKLYASPVPFSNYVTVTTQTKDAQKATFSLTNNLGVEVLNTDVWLKENVTDSVLNTENLPSGVYYLKVVSKDYQRVLKLVKE